MIVKPIHPKMEKITYDNLVRELSDGCDQKEAIEFIDLMNFLTEQRRLDKGLEPTPLHL